MQPGDRGRGVDVVETSIPIEPGAVAGPWPAGRMGAPEPALPETREHRCPSCASERLTPVSHVTAVCGLIKVEHRCEACATAFWLVRDSIA